MNELLLIEEANSLIESYNKLEFKKPLDSQAMRFARLVLGELE